MCIPTTMSVFEQEDITTNSTEIWSDEEIWSDNDYYQSDECDSGDSSEISALLKLYTFLLLMFQTLSDSLIQPSMTGSSHLHTHNTLKVQYICPS